MEASLHLWGREFPKSWRERFMRGCIRFVYVAYWLMASSFKLLFFSRPSSLFIRKKPVSLLGERKWINPSHSQLHHRRTLCGYPLEGVRRSCRGCFDYRLFIMSPTPIYLLLSSPGRGAAKGMDKLREGDCKKRSAKSNVEFFKVSKYILEIW